LHRSERAKRMGRSSIAPFLSGADCDPITQQPSLPMATCLTRGVLVDVIVGLGEGVLIRVIVGLGKGVLVGVIVGLGEGVLVDMIVGLGALVFGPIKLPKATGPVPTMIVWITVLVTSCITETVLSPLFAT